MTGGPGLSATAVVGLARTTERAYAGAAMIIGAQ